jgi:hypothetical protein
MSALLIFTVGHADVQLLEGGKRRELDKRSCGVLHEELARRQDWTIGESAVPKMERNERGEGQELARLPAGAFEVCTPKLDAVLTFLVTKGIVPSHALILHTTRVPRSGDPAQAGPILQRRLRERTGIEPTLVSYLSGEERIEDRRELRDAILRREVAARLDEAIAMAIDGAGASQVVVAATGGFPQVASLVRELVQLRAVTRPIDLDIPDASKQAVDGLDLASERHAPTDPSTVVAAKRHALDLVERGNFIAAWGAVAHLHNDQDCAPWTRVLRWLYEWASSLPHDPPMEPGALPFPGSEQRAAHVAMRVELALRCGDIPRAVQGTVSFFEAAVWDHLHSGYLRLAAASPSTGFPRFHVDPDPASVTDDKHLKEAMKRREGSYEIHNYGKRSITLAAQYLHQISTAKHLPTGALHALSQDFEKVLDLRNKVAHGEPTREVVAEMQSTMRDKALWSCDDRFLCQPLIREVLAELKVEEPDTLCEKLIGEVRSRILSSTRGR